MRNPLPQRYYFLNVIRLAAPPASLAAIAIVIPLRSQPPYRRRANPLELRDAHLGKGGREREREGRGRLLLPICAHKQ